MLVNGMHWWTAGRKDWSGVHGCGRPEEAEQKQEIGQEAC